MYPPVLAVRIANYVMDTVISEYQKWKQHGEQLRTQAKQAMEDRFRELLSEAVQIAQEYHQDFGTSLKPPPNVTAFRFKAGAAKKAGKGGKGPGAKAAGPAVKAAGPTGAGVSAPNAKVVGLQKRRAQLQKKLEEAKAASKPTKNLEDRIYEVEDELRLAGGAV